MKTTDQTPSEQIQQILSGPKPSPDEVAAMERFCRTIAMAACISGLSPRLLVISLITTTQAAAKACLEFDNLANDGEEQGFAG